MDWVTCPVCARRTDGLCQEVPTNGRDITGYDCETCGIFEVSNSAAPKLAEGPNGYNALERAAIAHLLRNSQGASTPTITTYWLDALDERPVLPSPSIQAQNLITLIGDHIQRTGGPYQADYSTHAIIGSPNLRRVNHLLNELTDSGLTKKIGDASKKTRGGSTLMGRAFDLTLAGWQRLEAERRGKLSANHGFIAMKFGDPVLDPFVDQHVKAVVRQELGFEVVDMRNVARAGLIDNIMRAQIRDSAFVLVDLTHDNSGAYWEAGYAEGLGKPVIYLCEKQKFETKNTHFDTNHCTTVVWSVGDEQTFCDQLVATIRRSLAQVS